MMRVTTLATRGVFRDTVFALFFSVCLSAVLVDSSAAAGKWWGDFAFLYLREEVSGESLFFLDGNDNNFRDSSEETKNTDEVLTWNPSGRNFGWRGEWGYDWPNDCGVSLAYLGRLYRNETSFTGSDTIEPSFGPDSRDVTVADLPDFEDSDLVIMELDTFLHSWEAILHVPVWQNPERFRLRGRLGPRLLWIRDTMPLDSFDSGPAFPSNRSDLNVDMDNLLFGLQVGLSLKWRVCSWFSLVSDINAGGYYAAIDQDVSFHEYDGARDTWSLGDSKDVLGVLAEARLMGEIRITDNLSARLGYMVLWLSDTGRSINQIKPGQGLDEELVDIRRGDRPEVEVDDSLYHGGVFAIVVRFDEGDIF
jgi:hypothetical protein